MRVLIIRLSSLGDIVHALPVAASLRQKFPDAIIDWVVDERNSDFLSLVPALDRVIVFRSRSRPALLGVLECCRILRDRSYDVALDVQGLAKSALLARLSGAERVIGFKTPFLRERWARFFYSETVDAGEPTHVIEQNLGLLTSLGVHSETWDFPIAKVKPEVFSRVRVFVDRVDSQFVLLNPNAAWPNKCWSTEKFGALAFRMHQLYQLKSVVLWGPEEKDRAQAVVAASNGTAVLAPPSDLETLVELVRAGTILVSGDTGPLHIAAAVGTPIVGLYGPSDPARNGPWSTQDVVVSRFRSCRCHQARNSNRSFRHVVRRCKSSMWCLDDIAVEDVRAAIESRLEGHLFSA